MRRLPWDSEFFGIQIGRSELPEEDLTGAVAAARAAGVECLYLFVAGAELRLVEAAARAGARLVDLRAALELDLSRREPVAGEGVRLAEAGDGPALEHAGEQLSRFSRFRADARFSPERLAEMYRIWVRQCLAGGWVAVPAVPPGRASSFVGVRPAAGEARVELVYVAPEDSGRGLGRALIAAGLERAPGSRASVTTQAGNTAALRLYQSLGFRTRSLTAVLHLWLDELG